MASRNYTTGLIITGDGTGAINAIALTDEALKNLNGTNRRAATESSSAWDKMKQSVSGVGTQFRELALAGAAAAAALVGFSSIKGFFTDVVSESEKLQRNLLRTEAVIKATVATAGFNVQQLHEQARQMALATLQSTEGVMAAQQIMLTFRSVTGDTFTRAMSLANDLSVTIGSDLNGAVTQLGKALEDPVKGMNAMARSGVSFSEAEQDVIKSLVETGQKAKAQSMILDVLAGQYGGIAEKEALGFAGAMDTLGQRMQELKIHIGENTGLLPALADNVNGVANAVLALDDNLPAVIAGLTTLGAIVAQGAALYVGMMAITAALPIMAAGWTAVQLQAALAFGALAAGVPVTALLTSSLQASYAMTMQNVTAFGLLKSAAMLLFAAFAGWQFGTYLREQFVEVRVAALAFVGATMTGLEQLSAAGSIAAAAIKAVFIGAFNIIKGAVGETIGLLSRGLNAVGADDMAGSLGRVATGMKPVTSAAVEMNATIAKTTAELKAKQAAIDDNIIGLINYERSTKTAAKTLDAYKASSVAGAAATDGAAEAHDKAGNAAKAHAKELNETAKAAKKLAQEEAAFEANAIKFLNNQQEQLRLLKLTGKERELETKISSDLNSVLGELYDSTKVYTEAKAMLIAEVMNNTMAIARETEAQERQNGAWAEAVKQANELYDIKRDTSDTQELARMAKTLSLMGATNEEVKQRIDLEKRLSDAVKAHPDQDPQVIRDNIIAQQRASDEIALYTDNNSKESADWMEAAFKKAAENIQDSFADMFESMLNGDAMDSIEAFAQNIRKTLNQAISQQLALDLQNLFSENGSIANVLKSGFMFAVSAAVNWLTKKPAARTAAPSEVGNSPVLGTGAMHIADSLGRDSAFAYQSKAVIGFNNGLNYLSSTLTSNAAKITDWIGAFGAKLSSISVVAQVAEFFRPVTSLIGHGLSAIGTLYTGVTNFISNGITAMTNFVGLTTAATAGVVDAISTGAAGTGTASEAASVAGGGTSAALSNVAVALAVIKFGYDVFTTWGNDALTTHTKVTNSLYALSDAMLSMSAATMNWPLAIAAAALNVAGVVSDVFENGLNKSNMLRLLLGPLAGLFDKPRIPNVWMNNYNPDQSGAAYQYNPNAETYSATGKKSGYVGEQTPFGMLVLSTHEMSMSADEMVAAFGGLLSTVKTVDTGLYHSIMKLDEAAGETGKTMNYFNDLLRSNNGNEVGVKTKQTAEAMNTGDMLQARYAWIADQLAASGSEVGQYINAWFDVITGKFIDTSKDNTMFVLGVIDSLATNIESFMAFPLELVELIGQSVKSIAMGGTPDSVMAEINGVLNAFTLLKVGFARLDLQTDDSRIVSFLANINAIGFGVADAGNNLLAYAIAVDKMNGAIITSGDELMATVEAKFASLKDQGLDNAQINAFFGSFGLMSKMFSEAGVGFNEADLDKAAQGLHDLAKGSVEVAKNTIDHLIATEKLTDVSRESAMATLVKTGKLEEATVAEAEYGASIMTVTKDLLAQMGFIQQLGFLAGQSLGEMGISADTWVAAAHNVVNVFGDMEKAMAWLDATARNFLSPTEYSQYNLDTAQRGISNLVESNPQLAGITADSIRAALQSGAIEGFIESFAQGNGELAKEIVTMINLVGRQSDAQRALNEAITANVQLAPAQVYAIDAVKVATEDSTNATDDLAKAAADAAALAKQYRDMEITLMGVQGLTHQALIEKRNDELAAMDSSLVKIAKQIHAQEDANKTRELEHKLMTLQGKEAEVLTATRERELLALSSADAGIQALIWSLEDAAAATAKTKAAFNLFATPEQKQSVLGQELYEILLPAFGSDLLVRMAEGGTKAIIEVYNELGNMGEEGKRLQAILIDNSQSIYDYASAVDSASKALQDILKSASTTMAQRDGSDIQTQLWAMRDTWYGFIKDAISNGANFSEAMGLFGNVSTLYSEAVTEASDKISEAFAAIYSSIDDRRFSVSMKKLELGGADTTQNQIDRTMAALASTDDVQKQLSYIDELISLNDQRYQDEISSVEKLVTIGKSLKDFLDSLLVNDALSILSPGDRLTEAGSQYDTTLALAKTGDIDALDKLQKMAEEYLTEGRGYYASTEDYVAIFNKIQADLKGLNLPGETDNATLTAQATQQSVEFLDSILTTLNSIDATQKAQEIIDKMILTTQAQEISDAFMSAVSTVMGEGFGLSGGITLEILGGDLPVEVIDFMSMLIETGNLNAYITGTLELYKTGDLTIEQFDIAGRFLVEQQGLTATIKGLFDLSALGDLAPDDFLMIGDWILDNYGLDATLKSILDLGYSGAITPDDFIATGDWLIANNGVSGLLGGLLNLSRSGDLTDARFLEVGNWILASQGINATLAGALALNASGVVTPSEFQSFGSWLITNNGVDKTFRATAELYQAGTATIADVQTIIGWSVSTDANALFQTTASLYSTKQITAAEAEWIITQAGAADQTAAYTASANLLKAGTLTLDEFATVNAWIAAGSNSVTKTINAATGTMPAQALSLINAVNSTINKTVNGILSGSTVAANLAATANGGTSYVSATATMFADSALQAQLNYLTNINSTNSATMTACQAIQWYMAAIYNGSPLKVYSAYRSGTLATFAKGGIANEASIFGEAGPEAAVPLPDGRSIPVTLSGAVGSGDNKETVAELKQQTAELKAARREAQQKADAMIQKLQMIERRLQQIESNGALAGAA